MLKLPLEIRAGLPVYEQIIMAAKRAIAIGILKAGDAFPSVREISRDFKINPNTVQKAIAALVAEKAIEIHPGRGSVVSTVRRPNASDIEQIFSPQLRGVVINARSMNVSCTEMCALLRKLWNLDEE